MQKPCTASCTDVCGATRTAAGRPEAGSVSDGAPSRPPAVFNSLRSPRSSRSTSLRYSVPRASICSAGSIEVSPVSSTRR